MESMTWSTYAFWLLDAKSLMKINIFRESEIA